MTTSVPAGSPHRLSYLWFAVIVISYLAIIKGVGYVAGQIWDVNDGIYTTQDVVVGMWLPLGAALVFTYAVVAVLRWWDPVLRERHPVQRWVWAVPIIFAVCIGLAIDYADLADKGLGYILALLVATQFVGWGEEGMFRGIGVTTLRSHGLTEGKVAMWSSVIFGAVHISNALTGDISKALPQAIAVSFAGYFFYLIRRVSGGNVLNSVLHGLFDFSILSATAIAVDQGGYLGSMAAILAYLIVGTLLIVRRRSIEPAPALAK
ncbi:CPBP family intramembrane glutamic endopeptidase [Nocardioides speluncae]|uniref:CPBP family intramembrane glutamic endopeptidase n=1 Tax=Nocardioides speluncae TaxID=2670337 RepID=UPI000D688CE7|nr:CPBP family intramembrane glutamic endopeptidase [Nocardioides speluncae]